MANKNINVTVTSNKQLYEEEFEATVRKILEQIGMDCASAAFDLAPYDTGLLRNSITYALAGEKAAQASYKADTGGGMGRYEGTSPEDNEEHVRHVHVGSNVEYALAQETGEFKKGPNAFLRPAINNNTAHFKQIIKDELSKALMND